MPMPSFLPSWLPLARLVPWLGRGKAGVSPPAPNLGGAGGAYGADGADGAYGADRAAEHQSSRARGTARPRVADGSSPLPAAAWLARVFFYLALLIFIAGAVIWSVRRPVFDLRRITIAGTLRHVNRAEIRTALAGRLTGNFFTLRLRDARDAFQSIPWVADASVRRVWPDRLRVRLTERRAVGTWDDGSLVSDAGVLFEGNPAEADLDGPQIVFTGPAQFAPKAVARVAPFVQACRALGTTLAGIAVSDRASWSLRTGRGQVFHLGRDDPPGAVRQRLDRIVRNDPVVTARLGGPPAVVDARYDNGFAASGPVARGPGAGAADGGDVTDGTVVDNPTTRQP